MRKAMNTTLYILTKKVILQLICSLSLIFILSYSVLSFSDESNDTQVGRYITVENKPSYAQIDLLSQTIQIHFPQNVQTVGDAMNYVLRLSGYSLVPINQMNSSLKITLSKPLPAIDRSLGPMSLSAALCILVGTPFYLVNDPINRMVDFHLKNQFAQIYKEKKTNYN